MTNGVLRGLSGLTKLHTLHMPDAYRVTNAGLHFISTLTGGSPACCTLLPFFLLSGGACYQPAKFTARQIHHGDACEASTTASRMRATRLAYLSIRKVWPLLQARSAYTHRLNLAMKLLNADILTERSLACEVHAALTVRRVLPKSEWCPDSACEDGTP